jgi:N6-adenosine-specific RNA methylase IME4
VSPGRRIERHYPTMTLDEICAYPVTEMCAPSAVLFLWATPPLLQEAFVVMNAWGFTYRTNAVWDKMRIGMGYYPAVL